MHCYREQKVQKDNIFIQLEKGAEIHLYTNYFFILAEHFHLILLRKKDDMSPIILMSSLFLKTMSTRLEHGDCKNEVTKNNF